VKILSAEHHLSFSIEADGQKATFTVDFEFPVNNLEKPVQVNGSFTTEDGATARISGSQVSSMGWFDMTSDPQRWGDVLFAAASLGLLGLVVHVCVRGADRAQVVIPSGGFFEKSLLSFNDAVWNEEADEVKAKSTVRSGEIH
jgi:hypothetical protein